MLLQEIVDGVIEQTKAVTGKNVYGNISEQGLEKGAFLVQVTETQLTRRAAANRLYVVTFAVTYTPTVEGHEELNQVEQQLMEHFGYLQVGESLLHIDEIKRSEASRVDALIIQFKVQVHMKVAAPAVEKMAQLEVQ